MLNTLDIVIGLAVIMTVLSLFITILVQMVSTGLALRGKNLANALSLTFQTIDPKIGEQAHSLAAQILRDPIFSDSIWRTKSRDVDVGGLALMDTEKKLAAAKQALQTESDPAKQAQLTALVGELNAAFDAAKANLGKLADLVKEERELKQATKDLAKAAGEDMRTVALRAVEAGKEKVAAARKAAKLPEVKLNRQKPWKFWTSPWDGARQLGNAIRPGEVYRVLHELAELTETEAVLKGIPAGLANTAGAIIQALAKEDRPTTEARQKLSLLNWVGDTYFKAMPAQQAALVNSLPDLAATVERATTQAYDRFQRWFGSGQDRAEQWFQTHMRGVTIVMAFLIAFLLQLDTVDIYRQLREQPALTAALVKAAPGVIEQSTTVLDPADTAAYHTYLLWLQKHPLFPLKTLPAKGTDAAYRDAIADRIKAAPDLEYPVQQFDKAFELAKNAEGFSGDGEAAAAKAAYDAWVKNFSTFALDPTPDDTATQQSVQNAIQAKVTADADAKAAPDQDKMKEWLAEYDSLQPAGKFAYETARQNAYRDLKKQMDAAGFALAPVPFLSRWDSEPLPLWARRIYPPAAHYLVHFIGVLMTAGLLTLGAPFWFNLLKNLTSLRPALAALIEKRPTSAPALPQAPATPGTS
jgi:hypothetical protein